MNTVYILSRSYLCDNSECEVIIGVYSKEDEAIKQQEALQDIEGHSAMSDIFIVTEYKLL